MKVEELPLKGLKQIHLDVYEDARGFFVERFNQAKFEELGLESRFLQDNLSRSLPRVLRGLHFQHDPAQGKLLSAFRGRIWDVVVDLRRGSETFGEHFGIELSETDGKWLWIPAGFAHGFCVLGDSPADVFYKVDQRYNPAGESGVHWADTTLGIDWPIKDPVVSKRDADLPSFNQLGEIHWGAEGVLDVENDSDDRGDFVHGKSYCPCSV